MQSHDFFLFSQFSLRADVFPVHAKLIFEVGIG